jgi:hypothetical protein
LYHWHGVAVPQAWIERRMTAADVLREQNLELRRAGIEILGWDAILAGVGARTIDRDNDPHVGELLEVSLPGLARPARFLRVLCGTGRQFVIGVPPEMTTALDAQAWMVGLEPNDFRVPPIRT